MPPRVHDYVIRGAGGWGAGETESGGDTHGRFIWRGEELWSARATVSFVAGLGRHPAGRRRFCFAHHTPRRHSTVASVHRARRERWPAPAAPWHLPIWHDHEGRRNTGHSHCQKLFATLLSLKYSDRRPPPSSAAFSLRHRAAAAHHGPPHPTRDSLWRRAAEGATSEAKESAQGQRVGCP